MIAPLLSKLPAPRIADWGYKVTICIAALSTGLDRKDSIVSVSDQKVSFTGFAADNFAVKDMPLWGPTWTLVAGNDIEFVPSILSRAKHILEGKQSDNAVEEAAYAIDQAYGDILHAEITRKVLRRRGFNVDTFLEKGRQKCTPSAYLALCEKIDRVNLSLNFLVCGFDDRGEGHIFSVDGQGAPKCYDTIGMWAIGDGVHLALSSLAFHVDRHQFSKYASVEQTLYFALAAKFMAESSGEVGKSTFISIETKDEPSRYLRDRHLELIRQVWESDGSPRVPSNLDVLMENSMTTIEQMNQERKGKVSGSATA